MRVAIFHDFFGSIGGGEKLTLEIAKALKADIITTEANRENIEKMESQGIRIINLGTLNFPIIKQILSSYKFAKAYFPDYDFYILSGNWAIFAAKKHRPNLFYCYTPVRMFYDSYNFFKKICPIYAKPFFMLWVYFHKKILEKNLKYIDKTISISKNTQDRVKKYYQKESKIIYPPVKQYKFKKFGNFWLSVTRIYPHKRLELQIEAFRQLPNEKLIIVGGYMKGDHAKTYAKKVLRNLPKNIIYKGVVSEKELEELYGQCKAFITTSKDEDFGMNVIEAMSAGKAVVVVNEGGYRESVINKKTGYLVNADVLSLMEAIKKISKNPSGYRGACERQANKFNIKIFVKKIKEIIKGVKNAI
ncbi:glycosyltransferase [Candidatus Pacearchaeota archaeon]|nr:glycosyltransferase [Candidatus Pacearchaeota archaeon]